MSIPSNLRRKHEACYSRCRFGFWLVFNRVDITFSHGVMLASRNILPWRLRVHGRRKHNNGSVSILLYQRGRGNSEMSGPKMSRKIAGHIKKDPAMRKKIYIILIIMVLGGILSAYIYAQTAFCERQVQWGKCEGTCFCTGGSIKDGDFACSFICNKGLPDEFECSRPECQWEGPAI